MPLGTVLIIVGIVSMFGAYGGFKKQVIDTVQWEREYNKKRCEQEDKYEFMYQSYHLKKICDSPRYGVPKQWWEKKTLEELKNEFENKKSTD